MATSEESTRAVIAEAIEKVKTSTVKDEYKEIMIKALEGNDPDISQIAMPKIMAMVLTMPSKYPDHFPSLIEDLAEGIQLKVQLRTGQAVKID